MSSSSSTTRIREAAIASHSTQGSRTPALSPIYREEALDRIDRRSRSPPRADARLYTGENAATGPRGPVHAACSRHYVWAALPANGTPARLLGSLGRCGAQCRAARDDAPLVAVSACRHARDPPRLHGARRAPPPGRRGIRVRLRGPLPASGPLARADGRAP